jgi:hypothetical protein
MLISKSGGVTTTLLRRRSNPGLETSLPINEESRQQGAGSLSTYISVLGLGDHKAGIKF